MFQLKKALKILLFLSIFNSSSVFAEEVGILSTELDSGILTDRNNKIFQQEKLQRTLKYEKEKRKQGIENLEERKEEDIKVSDVSFLLKKMEIPKSDILTEQEMERIWESYIEKEITPNQQVHSCYSTPKGSISKPLPLRRLLCTPPS